MRNHFETNKYPFPQKVFKEICSLFSHNSFKCWSADLFQERKRNKKSSETSPRNTCWYLLMWGKKCSFKNAAGISSSWELTLAHGKQSRDIQTGACSHQVLVMKGLPVRERFAKCAGCQETPCRLGNAVLLRVSKKGDLFPKTQWPMAKWRYLCKASCYSQWELLFLNKSDIQAVSFLEI